MLGALPQPLGDDFRDALIKVARARKLPAVDEPAKLGPLVAALSRAYNDETRAALVEARGLLPAKLGWSLPRDVHKVAAAVREVVALDRLPKREGSLSVLDLGAGLGATHRGLARALDAAGRTESLDVLAVDADGDAIATMLAFHAERPREGRVAIKLRGESVPIDAKASSRRRADRFDLVLLGQVISELDVDLDPARRVEAHTSLLESLLHQSVAPDGVLVVVEPALRPRSRHLQQVRASLLSRERPPRILGPCLHDGPCPLLVRETDWCHDDMPLDLPAWLLPVARAAGLRYQGLTYSSLILGQSGPPLRALIGEPHRRVVRMVSSPIVTKGKTEAIVCGDPLRGAVDATNDSHGLRIGVLDRQRNESNEALVSAYRGSLLAIEGELDPKNRLADGAQATLFDRATPDR
jgi:SAM-dependent methyltransferase